MNRIVMIMIFIIFVIVLWFVAYDAIAFFEQASQPQQYCNKVLHYGGEAGSGYVDTQCYPVNP